MSDKIKVVPCSGIGRVYGLIGRESVLRAVKDLCPDQAETVCLAYIVTGDDEAQKLIKDKTCITLDGCPTMCSAKSVELAGGIVREKLKVLDTVKKYRGIQPGTGTELTEEGWQLVDEIADEIVAKVNDLVKEGC